MRTDIYTLRVATVPTSPRTLNPATAPVKLISLSAAADDALNVSCVLRRAKGAPEAGVALPCQHAFHRRYAANTCRRPYATASSLLAHPGVLVPSASLPTLIVSFYRVSARRCIVKWLGKLPQYRCPMCRADLKDALTLQPPPSARVVRPAPPVVVAPPPRRQQETGATDGGPPPAAVAWLPVMAQNATAALPPEPSSAPAAAAAQQPADAHPPVAVAAARGGEGETPPPVLAAAAIQQLEAGAGPRPGAPAAEGDSRAEMRARAAAAAEARREAVARMEAAPATSAAAAAGSG